MEQRYGGGRKERRWRGYKIVFEMGGKDREIYSAVYGQGGITKERIKRKSGYESVGIQKKTEERKRGELTRLCWKDVRGRTKKEK